MTYDTIRPPRLKTDVPTVTIPLSEYSELLVDRKWLRCLEAAGVDNWDGYDIAQDMLDPDRESEST